MDGSISSYFECSIDGGEKHWNVRFIRQFNYWELESIASMSDYCIPKCQGVRVPTE